MFYAPTKILRTLPRGKMEWIAKQEWYPKSFQGYAGLLFIQALGAVTGVNTVFAGAMRFGGFVVRGTMCEWFWHVGEQRRVRPVLIRRIKANHRFAPGIVKKFLTAWQRFDRLVSATAARDLHTLPLRTLGRMYEQCVRAALAQASYGYILEPFLTAGEEDWLVQEIHRALPPDIGAEEKAHIVARVTTHAHPTFSQQESWARARLARQWKAGKRGPAFVRALTRHVAQFATVHGNYLNVPRLREHDVQASFRSVDIVAARRAEQALTQAKKEKVRIIRRYHLGALRSLLHCADLFAHMQDWRKWAVTKLNDIVFQLLDAMAAHLHVSPETLRFATPDEIIRACDGRRVDWNAVRERTQGALFWCTDRGVTIYQGPAMRGVSADAFQNIDQSMRELKGTTAMAGRVRGRVRIVYGRLEFSAFKKGEILVTNNTTPEFVPTMRKAAAIVTEQGGITAHAAIISRELKIPCVIGTKIATKILKTGDMVEVDATNGMVRKI